MAGRVEQRQQRRAGGAARDVVEPLVDHTSDVTTQALLHPLFADECRVERVVRVKHGGSGSGPRH